MRAWGCSTAAVAKGDQRRQRAEVDGARMLGRGATKVQRSREAHEMRGRSGSGCCSKGARGERGPSRGGDSGMVIAARGGEEVVWGRGLQGVEREGTGGGRPDLEEHGEVLRLR